MQTINLVRIYRVVIENSNIQKPVFKTVSIDELNTRRQAVHRDLQPVS